MNQKQKVVLWVAVALFVLMGLFPPWTPRVIHVNAKNPEGYYDFILLPSRNGHINTERLFIQWFTLGGASAAVIFALKKPS